MSASGDIFAPMLGSLAPAWQDYGKFLLRFLGVYVLLYSLGLFLLGAADPKGSIFWPVFSRFCNLFIPLTDVLVSSSIQVLEWLGYDIGRPAFHKLRVGNATLAVNQSCLGYAVKSFWLAFVWANRPGLRAGLAWSVGGVVLLIGINIVRIVLIVLGLHHRWWTPGQASHEAYHTTFNIAAYGAIFLLIYAFYRWDKRRQLAPPTRRTL